MSIKVSQRTDKNSNETQHFNNKQLLHKTITFNDNRSNIAIKAINLKYFLHKKNDDFYLAMILTMKNSN